MNTLCSGAYGAVFTTLVPIVIFFLGILVGKGLGLLQTDLRRALLMGVLAGPAVVFLNLLTHQYEASANLAGYAFCDGDPNYGLFLVMLAFYGLGVETVFNQLQTRFTPDVARNETARNNEIALEEGPTPEEC